MEFMLDKGSATYQIQSCYQGVIFVNQIAYNHPILVMPETLVSPWGPTSFEDLSTKHFEQILTYQPQLVLLGTGETLRFPDQQLLEALINHQIGVEVMDTKAACRTYAILMAEGRKVLAALL